MSGSQEVNPKTVSIGVNNLLLAKFSQSGGPVVKNPAAIAGHAGSIPGSGRYHEKGNGYHSNIHAWQILWTAKSGRLQSIGHKRVKHDLMATTTSQSCGQIQVQ